MNLAPFLSDPLTWGLGLLGAGVVWLVVFVFPSVVFPSEPAAAAPPPPVDHTPFLHRRLESVVRPLDRRLTALEARRETAREAAVPSAGDLRRLYDGLDGVKRGMDDVRSLTGSLSAGARDRQDLGRQVDALASSTEVFLKQDTVRPTAAPGLAGARAERAAFEQALRGISVDAAPQAPFPDPAAARDALAREASRLAQDRNDLNRLERQTEDERLSLSKSKERARAQERLMRRLAAWRKSWRDRLAAEESRLLAAKAQAEARRQAVQLRRSEDQARLDAERSALEAERRSLDGHRQRFEEQVLRPWREEKARGEAEVRDLEGRIIALRTEMAGMEADRRSLASSSPVVLADEKRRAREEQARWRETVRRSREEQGALAAREELEARSLKEAAAREEAALREALARARETIEKERAAFAAQEEASHRQAGREGEEARARLEERRREAQGLQESRDSLAAALDDEKKAHAGAVESLKSWAVQRYTHLRGIMERAAAAAQESVSRFRAEKAELAARLDGEKEAVRRDLSALEGKASSDREQFQAALRRAEEEHNLRMAELARQEAGEKARGEELSREAASLKSEAERLRAQARDRLIRRRAAHEKRYVQLRQKVESQAVDDAHRMAKEREALHALEARLVARRRRMDGLRGRRRAAMASLLERAAASFQAAADARGRTEEMALSRLAAFKDRSVQGDLLRRRWAEAPKWIEESAVAGEARSDLAAEAERSALLAETEQRQEEALRLFEENRRELERAAARLGSAEGALDDEEVAERVVMGQAADLLIRLERLKVFFEAVRLPSEDVQSKSRVA